MAALETIDASTIEKETPSFDTTWNESFCNVGEPNYIVSIRAQTQQDLLKGATSILDPQVEEARQ